MGALVEENLGALQAGSGGAALVSSTPLEAVRPRPMTPPGLAWSSGPLTCVIDRLSNVNQ